MVASENRRPPRGSVPRLRKSVFGLFWKRLQAPALLAGWFVGIAYGTWTAFADGVKPVHTLHFGADAYTVYTGLLALTVNIVVALVVQALFPARKSTALASA